MDTKEFYEHKTTYRMNAERKKHILQLVPEEIRTVLDVGCAEGELAQSLKQKGCMVTGVDISALALAKATALEKSFCFHIEDEVWPKELMEKRFDLIIASEIIEHVFYPPALLSKLRAFMAPGGKLILTTPNFLFWKNRVRMFLGRFAYEDEGLLDYGHIRFFTIDTIRSLLRKEGFTIEREHHFYPNLYARGLERAGKHFPGLLAYQMIFLLSRNAD